MTLLYDAPLARPPTLKVYGCICHGVEYSVRGRPYKFERQAWHFRTFIEVRYCLSNCALIYLPLFQSNDRKQNMLTFSMKPWFRNGWLLPRFTLFIYQEKKMQLWICTPELDSEQLVRMHRLFSLYTGFSIYTGCEISMISSCRQWISD